MQAGKELKCPTDGCEGILTSVVQLGMEDEVLQRKEVFHHDPPAKPVKIPVKPPQPARRKGVPCVLGTADSRLICRGRNEQCTALL